MEAIGLMRTGKLAMEHQGLLLVVPSLVMGRYDNDDVVPYMIIITYGDLDGNKATQLLMMIIKCIQVYYSSLMILMEIVVNHHKLFHHNLHPAPSNGKPGTVTPTLLQSVKSNF